MEQQQDKATEEATIIGEPATDEAASGKESTEKSKAKPKPKKRRKSSFLFWFLLIVIIGGLVAGWVKMPEQYRQKISTFVITHLKQLEKAHQQQPPATTSTAPTTSETSADTSTPATAPANENASAASSANEAGSVPAPAPESAATLPKNIPAELPAAATPAEATTGKTAPTTPSQAASPEEINALTASINKLTAELRDMKSEQQQLQQSMLAQQQLQLRAHLNRIAASDSRLPQMATEWQDILLLPILNNAQRTEVETMQQLASADSTNLQRWQKQLTKLANNLPTPKHGNIIPKPQNSWLSWLVGQFHLRQAPTADIQAITALHNRLIDARNALAAESWPDAKSWKALLDEAHTRLGEKVDLGLPGNFSGLQQDKMKMQALAQNWLEQL